MAWRGKRRFVIVALSIALRIELGLPYANTHWPSQLSCWPGSAARTRNIGVQIGQPAQHRSYSVRPSKHKAYLQGIAAERRSTHFPGWHEQLHRCLWPPSHDHIVIEYLMQHACQAVLLLALYPWRPVDAPSTCNPVVTRHPQCSQRHAPPSRPKASLLGTLTRLMDVLLGEH